MGEFARQPDAPNLPNTPLELLTPRPEEGYSIVDKNFLPVVGALTGFGAVLAINRLSYRPLWAGIHFHFIATFAGYFVGVKAKEFKMLIHEERDAIYKHYVLTHPDDFPPYEKRRFKDLFLPWHPVR